MWYDQVISNGLHGSMSWVLQVGTRSKTPFKLEPCGDERVHAIQIDASCSPLLVVVKVTAEDDDPSGVRNIGASFGSAPSGDNPMVDYPSGVQTVDENVGSAPSATQRLSARSKYELVVRVLCPSLR